MADIQPIIKEVTVNAPISKVWGALTEKEQLAKWFHASGDYTGEVGKTFHMDVTHEGKDYQHTLTIREKIANKKLALDWHINGDAGQTHVIYDLEPEGNKTRVRVTHSGFEKYGAEGEKNRNGYNQGWDHVLNKLLKEYLEN